MAELTIGQLIKLILGVAVFVVVVIGVYMFFKEKVFTVFGTPTKNGSMNLVRAILG